MGTHAEVETEKAAQAMEKALLDSYCAALAHADGLSASVRLVNLLRCSFLLSDPGNFAFKARGTEVEMQGQVTLGGQEWAMSAMSCHIMRQHVDDKLRACMRTVISDGESLSVIKECASAAVINDTDAPMLDQDIRGWREFEKMRGTIQHAESLIPIDSMKVTMTAPTPNGPVLRKCDDNGRENKLVPPPGGCDRMGWEQGRALSLYGGRGRAPEELKDGHERTDAIVANGNSKRQRLLQAENKQMLARHGGGWPRGNDDPQGFDYHEEYQDRQDNRCVSRVERSWARDGRDKEGERGMDRRGGWNRTSGDWEGGGGQKPHAMGMGENAGCVSSAIRSDFISGSDKFRQDLAEKNGARGGGRGPGRGGGGTSGGRGDGGGAFADWQAGSQYSGGGGGGGGAGKTLGGKRTVPAPPSGGFKCPWKKKEEREEGGGSGGGGGVKKILNRLGGGGGSADADGAAEAEEQIDPRYKNIDPKMIEMIENEIVDNSPGVSWDDIAGLEFAKSSVQEIVVWPMLRPDLFTGLRGPPKGLLLFGPPGTGKTLIGKTIATESNATFFSISASSLMSKWVGEGERMVRALFAVARVQSPSVIFIDEIDSLLSQRGGEEGEASRRVKTEFLVQMDGVGNSTSGERLLLIGATNRPQELDEAARRRMVKRLYIPLPDLPARIELITRLLSGVQHSLESSQVSEIALEAEGYSGADVKALCQESSLGPIREIRDIRKVSPSGVRPICFQDFKNALRQVRASVGTQDIAGYLEWNRQFGSFPVGDEHQTP